MKFDQMTVGDVANLIERCLTAHYVARWVRNAKVQDIQQLAHALAIDHIKLTITLGDDGELCE